VGVGIEDLDFVVGVETWLELMDHGGSGGRGDEVIFESPHGYGGF
jgi:hypothetical protein